MSTITVKVNTQTETLAEHKVVTQNGKPTIIKAIGKVNYELLDESTGHAPNHIITKRIDKALHISFENDSENPDLIIEGFYDDVDSALIGMAEDGSYYYYIPDSGEVADYVTELQTGEIQGQALGGNAQVAPWWVGATETDSFNAFPWLVGLAGVGLLGAALAGSNNDSKNTNKPLVDTTAPDAPTDLVVSEDGSTLTGKGEPGANVEITSPNGDVIGEGIVDENGEFEVDLVLPQVDGEKIEATLTDKAGNTSDPAETTAPDLTAPDAPTAEINPEGTLITGTTEPGAIVNVDINGDGVPDYTVTADNDGNYEVDTSDTPLIDGETITVTATDAAGNKSEPTDIVAKDTTAPDAPTTAPVITDNVANDGSGAVLDPAEVIVSGGVTNDNTPSVIVPADQVTNGTPQLVIDGKVVPSTSVTNPDGTVTLTPETALTDGDHSLSYNLKDAAGNVSADAPAVTVTVDTIAPDAPTAEINPEGMLITGSTEPSATVNVDINGDGVPDYTVTADNDGNYEVDTSDTPLIDGETITVTAIDKAGNKSEPTDIVAEDTTAPGGQEGADQVAPIVSIAEAVDGVNATEFADGIQTQVTLPTGTLEGDSITITVTSTGGGDPIEIIHLVTDLEAAAGVSEATIPNGVGGLTEDGDYTVVATVTDIAGNTSAASEPVDFTLDTIAPTDPIAAPIVTDNVANDGSGAVLDPAEVIASGGLTNDNTPSVIVPANQVTNGTPQLVIDGKVVPSTSVTNPDGTVTLTPETALTDGDHSLSYNLKDAAGNVSADAPVSSVVVDTLAPGEEDVDGDGNITPVAPIVSIAEAVDGVNATEFADGIQAVVTLPEGTVVGDTITLTVTDADGNEVVVTKEVSAAEALAGSAEVTIPNGMGGITDDGDYTVVATVTDISGNTSAASEPVDFTLNTTAPTDPIAAPVITDNVANDGSGAVLDPAEVIVSGGLTNDNTPSVIVPANQVTNGTSQLVIDGKVVPSTSVTNPDGTVTLTPETALTDGDHSLSYNLKDAAGNVSADAPAVTVTVDTIAPTDPIAAPVVTDNVANDGSGAVLDPAEVIVSGGVTNDNTPSVIVPADQVTNGTPQLVIDGKVVPSTSVTNPDGTVTLTPETALTDGDHSLSYNLKDAAGNVSADAPAVTVTVDTVALLTVNTPIAGDNVVNAEEAEIGFNVTGTGTVGDVITLTNGVGTPIGIGTATVGVNGKWSIAVTQADIDAMGEGSEVLTATAKDTAGNIATTTVNITVVPATALTITSPIAGDDIVNAEEAGVGFNVTGTGKENDIITLINEAGDTVGTATVGVNGRWSIAVDQLDIDAMGEGSEVLTATSTISSDVTSATITIDTVAPDDDTTEIIVDNITPDNVINAIEAEGNIAITGKVSGDYSEGNTVTIKVNGINYTGEVDFSGNFSIDVLGTELVADADKIIEVSVTATDAAGNIGTVNTTKDYTVDTDAPTAPTTTIVVDNLTDDNVINEVEAGADVAVTGTVTGEFTVGDIVTVMVDGTDYTSTVDIDGKFSIDVPGTKFVADADKIIEVSVAATDQAGNIGSVSITKDYMMDRIAPDDISTQITVNDLADDNVINKAESEADVAITGTVNGEFTLDDVVTVTVNGADYTGTVDVDGNFSIDVPGTELVADLDKVIEVSVSATDAAGNVGMANTIKEYTVNTDEIIAAADNFVDLQLTADPEVTNNGTQDKTGFGVVNAGLGPVLSADVIAAPGTSAITFSVGENEIRKVTMQGDLGGVAIGATTDLYVYKLNESTNQYEQQDFLEDWVVAGLLFGKSKETGFDLTEGKWAFSMVQSEGVAVAAGYTLYVRKDETLDYTNPTNVSGTTSGNILTGDDPQFGLDELPTGSKLSIVKDADGNDFVISENGSTVIEGQYGSLTIQADGEYNYVLNDGFTGPYGSEESFTYVVTSPDGNTSSADLTIQLNIFPVEQRIEVDATVVVDVNPSTILDTDKSDIDPGLNFAVVATNLLGPILSADVLGGSGAMEFTVGENQIRELALHGSAGGISIGKTFDMYIYKLDPESGNFIQVHQEKSWFKIVLFGGRSETLTMQFDEGEYRILLNSKGLLGVAEGAGVYVDHDKIYDYDAPLTFTGSVSEDATEDASTVLLKVNNQEVELGQATTVQGKYGTLVIESDGTYIYNVDKPADAGPDWKPPYGERDSFQLVTKDANGKATVEKLNIKISTHTATDDFNVTTVNEVNVTSEIGFNRDSKLTGNYGKTANHTFEITENKEASVTIEVQSSAKNVVYTLTNNTTGEVFTKTVSGKQGQSLSDSINDLPVGQYTLNITTSGYDGIDFTAGNIKGYQFNVDLIHTDEFKATAPIAINGDLLANDTSLSSDIISELKIGNLKVFVADVNKGADSIDIQGQFGILTVSKDGSYKYVPKGGIYGVETFIYETTSKAGVKETATLEINVGKTIIASIYNDVAVSSAADDSFTMGAGADTLVFNNLSGTEAGNGNNGVDIWTDFSGAQGDQIDITGLLDGNQTASNIGDYLKYEDGVLMVDRNGNAEYEALLQVTATDLTELLGSIKWQVAGANIANYSIGAIGEDAVYLDDIYGSSFRNFNEGSDTFNLTGSGQTISLSDFFETEVIDISGTGANTLNIREEDVTGSEMSNPLYVRGDGDDTVNLQGNDWSNTGQTLNDNAGQTYAVWQIDNNFSSQAYNDTEIANII